MKVCPYPDPRTPYAAYPSVVSNVASRVAGTSDPTGDVRRVKELLANAPTGRAWRRRGLLILCRAFPDRCLPEGETEGSSSQEQAAWMVPGPVVRKRPKWITRWTFAPPGTGATGLVPDSTGDAEVGDGGDGAQQSSEGQEVGRKTARLLVGLQEEAVFRHIVKFL